MAEAYGWTPDIVNELTLTQVNVYLTDSKELDNSNDDIVEKRLLRQKLLEKAHKQYNGNVPQEIIHKILKQTEH